METNARSVVQQKPNGRQPVVAKPGFELAGMVPTDVRRRIYEAVAQVGVEDLIKACEAISEGRGQDVPPLPEGVLNALEGVPPAAVRSLLSNEVIYDVVDDLEDLEERPLQWLWQDRLAYRMLNLIAGPPKVGKSNLVAGIIKAVTNGTSLPDNPNPTIARRVLYLTGEEDLASVVRPGFRRFGVNLKRVVAGRLSFSLMGKQHRLKLPEHQQELIDLVQ